MIHFACSRCGQKFKVKPETGPIVRSDRPEPRRRRDRAKMRMLRATADAEWDIRPTQMGSSNTTVAAASSPNYSAPTTNALRNSAPRWPPRS
jgi:hypothetical protein